MKKHLLKLIGLAILIYILAYQINFQDFVNVVSVIQFNFLLALIAMDVLFIIIKMFRWRYVLHCLKINYKIQEIAKIYYLSLVLGTFTPASSGDILARSAFLVKDGERLNAALISIFIDRLADVFTLLLIAIIGFIIFIPLFGAKSLIVTIIILAAVIIAFLIINLKNWRNAFKKIFMPLLPKYVKDKWVPHLIEAYDNIHAFEILKILALVGYTLLAQIVNLLFLFILAGALNIGTVPPLYLLLASTVTSFIVLIPVSIGGLGTREAVFVAMFSLYGVATEKSVAFSLSIMLLPLASLLVLSIFYSLMKLAKK